MHAFETARTARVYRLVAPDGGTFPARPADGRDDGDAGPLFAGDGARWRALGKLAARAHRRLLHVGCASAADLASALRWTPAAARHQLRRLRRAGLARRTGRLWQATGDVDDVSRVLGTHGSGARQRAALGAELARRAAVLAIYRVRARARRAVPLRGTRPRVMYAPDGAAWPAGAVGAAPGPARLPYWPFPVRARRNPLRGVCRCRAGMSCTAQWRRFDPVGGRGAPPGTGHAGFRARHERRVRSTMS